MLGNERQESQERLDRIGLKVLRSLKVSEEEIDAVAGSPDLYDRLRSRIEAGPRQERGEGALANGRFAPVRWGLRRSVLWTLAAAAAVLLLAATLLIWRPKPSTEPSKLGQSSSPQTPAAPQQELGASLPATKPESAAPHVSRLGTSPDYALGQSRRRRAASRSSEVATEFFPLTFIADSTALETGQVVRVRIPRSALVSFGVPMNVERAGELVKADVVIGDDGLARSIRFIQ